MRTSTRFNNFENGTSPAHGVVADKYALVVLARDDGYRCGVII